MCNVCLKSGAMFLKKMCITLQVEDALTIVNTENNSIEVFFFKNPNLERMIFSEVSFHSCILINSLNNGF